MEKTDADIIRRVLAGDVEDFGLLVDRYYPRYARIALHITGDREDAEDALQDTFLRAFRALPTYEERERFGAWLLRILVNQCRTQLSRRRRAVPLQAEWVRREAISEVSAADQIETAVDLQKALQALPETQREALVLKYSDDLSYEEMSGITGVAISALKMRVKRGAERLRELLAGIHDHA
jgi:RNA polymerase sigma-70 factor, ECF subfamily